MKPTSDELLPRVLCASCRHCTSRELVRGHRRRGWCEVGHGLRGRPRLGVAGEGAGVPVLAAVRR